MAKRVEYRNGDPITLKEGGCDGCKPTMINGVFCHETGCPERWRDYESRCNVCGCGFYRTEHNQSVCDDCREFEELDEVTQGFEDFRAGNCD